MRNKHNRNFRFSVLTIFVLTILSSCITSEKCNEKFPPRQFDSIREWVSYTCDSFPVYIPVTELTFDTNGFIPVDVNFDAIRKKNGLTQTISVHKGKLTAICREDSLKQIIEYERANKFTDRVIKEIVEVKTNILTRFQSFLFICGWLFWICLLLFIIWLILYLTKK